MAMFQQWIKNANYQFSVPDIIRFCFSCIHSSLLSQLKHASKLCFDDCCDAAFNDTLIDTENDIKEIGPSNAWELDSGRELKCDLYVYTLSDNRQTVKESTLSHFMMVGRKDIIAVFINHLLSDACIWYGLIYVAFYSVCGWITQCSCLFLFMIHILWISMPRHLHPVPVYVQS